MAMANPERQFRRSGDEWWRCGHTLPVAQQRLSAAVPQCLNELGVELHVNERGVEVHPDGLVTASGKVIPARIMVWSAGIKAPDYLANPDSLETNHINPQVTRSTLHRRKHLRGRQPDGRATGGSDMIEVSMARPGLLVAAQMHQVAQNSVQDRARDRREHHQLPKQTHHQTALINRKEIP